MTYLLDAHTFLWWARDNPALSQNARIAIQSPNNLVALSVASVWELSLKCSLGKLPDFQPFQNSALLSQFLVSQGIQLLPITLEDIAQAASLPMYHKDPFDRMLVAQAQRQQMTLVSKDDALRSYAVQVIW